MSKSTATDVVVLIAGCLGVVVLCTVVICLSSILNGLAISCLWNWFLVPKFAIAPIGIVHAIVIAMFGHLIAGNINQTNNTDKNKLIGTVVGFAFFRPLFVIGIAYLLLYFV